jgi:Mrp family chromosome partitioning ATPase
VKDILMPALDGNGLTVLPAGMSRLNPGQLACSPNAAKLFHELRERFRFIVVDSVPILPFVDGRALSPLVDAVVFVGRAGLTTRTAMRRSMELLADVHAAPIIEFVLNGADISSTEYYQYGYASYGNATYQGKTSES